ncbi:MAG: hypothetical protein J6I40_03005 [Mailhella sp.]|nr:hypothetical protein [Mailhella sp.]
MAFTGWENARAGEEFSLDEITSFYGNIGPYSLLELPRRSLWGRFPLVARAVAKDGVPGKFKPGERVIAFLQREGNNCSVAAFPAGLVDQKGIRSVIAAAEMQSLKNSMQGGLWTEQFNARLYVQPYTPELRKLEPPYKEEDMDGIFKKLADAHGQYGDFALASEPFSSGANAFPNFAFALASQGADAAPGVKLYSPWDVVLLFFGKPPSTTVLAVPLRAVAFWDQDKICSFAEGLGTSMS